MNGGDGGSGSTSKIIDLEEEDLVPKNNIQFNGDQENNIMNCKHKI